MPTEGAAQLPQRMSMGWGHSKCVRVPDDEKRDAAMQQTACRPELSEHEPRQLDKATAKLEAVLRLHKTTQ